MYVKMMLFFLYLFFHIPLMLMDVISRSSKKLFQRRKNLLKRNDGCNILLVVRQRQKVVPSSCVTLQQFTSSPGSALSISPDDSYFFIVIRKGTRACTQYSNTNYVCYDSLSFEFRAFSTFCHLFLFHIVFLKLFPSLSGKRQWRKKCGNLKRIRHGMLTFKEERSPWCMCILSEAPTE